MQVNTIFAIISKGHRLCMDRKEQGLWYSLGLPCSELGLPILSNWLVVLSQALGK